MKKTPRTAAAIIALGLMTTACSTSVGPDEVGLEYNAGLFSDTSFDQCVEAGNREVKGPGDKVYVYPGGQRTFAFNNSEENPGEMTAEKIVTSDGMEMTASGVVTFQLNPDCETLQSFHEGIGLKYQAYKNDGWVSLLQAYLGEPLRRALDDASTEFEWRDLYTSDEVKSQWEDRVGELLNQYVNEMGGGDFFISATFAGEEDEEPGSPTATLQRPVPPGDVRNAMTEAHTIAQEVENSEAREELVDAEAQAIEALVDLLGPEGYVLYEAIKNGDVDVVAVSPGTGVSVPSSRD